MPDKKEHALLLFNGLGDYRFYILLKNKKNQLLDAIFINPNLVSNPNFD